MAPAVDPRADRVAVLVLLLLPCLLLAPAWLPGRVLSPLDHLFTVAPWQAVAPGPVQSDPALGDVTQVFHPWTLYARGEIRAGRFPLWNPYAYAGTPFLSNPQTALLFPLTWLTWALPPALALTVPSVLKLMAAGLAMYGFLRRLALLPAPAFIGAAGFMLSSTMIAWLPWTYATTMVFLPLLFALVDRLAQKPDGRGVAWLALAVGLDGLAGYPQATFHALVATAVWGLARTPWRGGAGRYLVCLVAGAALGMALTAAQALPALDYLRESAVYAYRGQWTMPLSVPGRAAVTALMPAFFGVGAERWSAWQFAITSTYVGLGPLLGLPLAALAWRRSPTVFFAGLVAAVAAVHYGAPGVSGAVASAPGMALGNNLRLMPLLVLGVCTLGALGLDAAARHRWPGATVPRVCVRAWTLALVAIGLVAVALVSGDAAAQAVHPSPATQYVLSVVGLVAGAVCLLGWLADGRVRWGVALAGVQVLSLAPLAATYLPVRDSRWLYPTPPAVAWLQARTGEARVLMADHVGMLYGLRQANGYDGLSPRRIEQLAGAVGRGQAALHGYLENTLALHGSEPLAPLTVLLSPARELFGIRYIALAPGTPPPPPGLPVVYDGPDARIFEDPAALPRTFVAARARCVDDRTALALLRARAIDARREVLLADCTAPPAATTGGGSARIVTDAPDRVVIAASADAPAWLVLADTWFPGWHARVDGVEVAVRRAHHAFRAIALPAGRHEVEFTFWPRRLAEGIAISVGAVVVIVALLRPRRRTAAAALVGTLFVVTPAAADLPAPPFDLAVAPAAAPAGTTITVSARPRPGAPAGGPWDLYVLWLHSERAAFLTPDGVWWPRPVPWRARLEAGQTATGPWRSVGPPGDIELALVVVAPGQDPLDRLGWRFRPTLARVSVPASPAPLAGDRLVLPAVAALLGGLVVALWPLASRRRR